MTINAVQNYTRLMAPAFSDLDKIPVFTWFQSLFTSGQTIIELDASAIDIDIQRGNKKISSPFGGRFCQNGCFHLYKFLLIKNTADHGTNLMADLEGL